MLDLRLDFKIMHHIAQGGYSKVYQVSEIGTETDSNQFAMKLYSKELLIAQKMPFVAVVDEEANNQRDHLPEEPRPSWHRKTSQSVRELISHLPDYRADDWSVF